MDRAEIWRRRAYHGSTVAYGPQRRSEWVGSGAHKFQNFENMRVFAPRGKTMYNLLIRAKSLFQKLLICG